MHETKRNAGKVLIVKPARRAQGKGIYLVPCSGQGIKKLPKKKGCYVVQVLGYSTTYTVPPVYSVSHWVQEYIERPLLIDQFKFDLRIYVLVVAVDPLIVYIYKDGLARLATAPYEKPKASNLKTRCMVRQSSSHCCEAVTAASHQLCC